MTETGRRRSRRPGCRPAGVSINALAALRRFGKPMPHGGGGYERRCALSTRHAHLLYCRGSLGSRVLSLAGEVSMNTYLPPNAFNAPTHSTQDELEFLRGLGTYS